jgi:hypothetical protein
MSVDVDVEALIRDCDFEAEVEDARRPRRKREGCIAFQPAVRIHAGADAALSGP